MTLLTTIREAAEIAKQYEGSRRGRVATIPTSMCWLCGHPASTVDCSSQRVIELAHIVAVEESPSSENSESNLVPLCRAGSVASVAEFLESAPDDIDIDWTRGPDVGCHDLYDEGLIPRTHIRLSQSLQGFNLPRTREARSAESLAAAVKLEYGSSRGLRHASNMAWTRWEAAMVAGHEKDSNASKILEATACDAIKFGRRRSHNGAAKEARYRGSKALDFIRAYAEANSTAWKGYQRLFYETALAYTAAEEGEIGCNEDSERANLVELLLGQSITFARRAKIDQAWYSEIELLHVTMLHFGRLGSGNMDALDSHFARLLSSNSHQGADFEALRWDINFLLVKARYHIMRFETGEARECMRDAQDRRDAGKGWTAMQRIHINIVVGMALALEGHLEASATRLIRAITAMSGGRAKRPEGIVDAIDCLAAILPALRREPLTTCDVERDRVQLALIADRINDGRSGIWTAEHGERVSRG